MVWPPPIASRYREELAAKDSKGRAASGQNSPTGNAHESADGGVHASHASTSTSGANASKQAASPSRSAELWGCELCSMHAHAHASMHAHAHASMHAHDHASMHAHDDASMHVSVSFIISYVCVHMLIDTYRNVHMRVIFYYLTRADMA